MTKGGYMIIKKDGKVSQTFGSKAKAARFAKESRGIIAASTGRAPPDCSSQQAEADRPAAARPKSARAASRRRNLADRPHENERP